MSVLSAIVHKTENQFSEQVWFRNRTRWFLNVLYVFILFKCTIWLFQFDVLFSETSGVHKSENAVPPLWKFVFFLYNDADVLITRGFILALMLFALIMLIVKRMLPVLHLVIWLLLLNIHQSIYNTLSGGDYLLQQLVLCSVFLQKQEPATPVKRTLHNLSTLALVVQICILYVTAGWFKFLNVDWQQGQALFWIFKQDVFNMFAVPSNFVLALFFNYLVMFYQLCFPLLFFIKKGQRMFISMGILMHLYIMLGMGLWSFGCVSLIPYILFLERRNK